MSDKPISDAGPLALALTDETMAARLIGIGFDFLMQLPLGDLVEPEAILRQVELQLQPEYLTRTISEHVLPLLQREKERSAERDDRLADFLTPRADDVLRRLASQPIQLKKKTLKRLVKQDAVKHLLRNIVEETLERFVQMIKPGGKGGGAFGAVSRGAMGIASRVGRGVFSGIGNQLEEQLKKAVSQFIQGSMSLMLDRLVVILSQPETAQKFGQAGLNIYESALKTRWSVLLKQLHYLPLDELLQLIPGLVQHNLARPEVREVVLTELRAALDVEKTRSVGDTLGEALAEWRAYSIRVGTPILTRFGGSAEFAGFLEQLKQKDNPASD